MSPQDREHGGPTSLQRAARRARDRVLRGARDLRDAAEAESPSQSPSAPTASEPAPGTKPGTAAAATPEVTPGALATGLEPELAEPPEIEFDLPGPPRITGRAAAPRSPREPVLPPEPETGEIEIRPLTTELGIHPESIPPPEAGPEPAPAVADDRPEHSPAPAGPAPWAGFAESFEAERPADGGAVAGADSPIPPFAGPRRAPLAPGDEWTLVPPPGSRAPTAIAAAMLFLGGLGTGIAVTLLATENDGSPGPAYSPAALPAPTPPAATPADRAAGPVPLLPRAFALDPYGGDGEHQEQARLAVDGNPRTAWTTQRYATGALGKPGVGIAVTGARSARAREIVIRTPTPGFRAQIYGAPGGRPAAGAPRRGWTRLAGTSTVASGRPIRLSGAASMRHWLVWIVALAPGRHSAEISEIGLLR